MCGIAGYIGDRAIEPDRVAECQRRMHRRGPDANGVYRHQVGDRHVCLIHSRLGILDLDERSNQPFQIGSTSLVYNGEIYNYVELRDRLGRDGHSFNTSGDTEVLARSLATTGVDALDECEGMWAFAFYNEVDGTLILSRDRFGEKPLYFHRDSTGLYFGSEPKFIFALMGRTLPVNMDHIRRYLVNGYKSLYKVSDTFFEQLEELQPGTCMRIDRKGEVRSDPYWAFKLDREEAMTYGDAVVTARDLLLESVKRRLRSDVPLAFCMSGGIDSNALISLAKCELDYDVEGFTIVNTDARYDEWDITKQSASELGINHHAVPVTTDAFLPRLTDLIRYHDAPVYTITYYAQWLLMQEIANQGFRVSISGTAADELFSGYYDHHLAYLRDVHANGGLHQQALENWTTHIKPHVRNPHLSNPDLFIDDPMFRDHIYLDADLFREYLVESWPEQFHERRFCADLLRNRMLNELFDETVPVILHDDDLNAMYYSIENRSPFLDRHLFEFCNRIPTRHLVHNGYAKCVLRDAVRGVAPDIVLDNHRKVGFNAPIHSFLNVKDSDVRSQLLDESSIFDYVRRDRIESLLNETDLPNSRSKFLFNFLNSKIFLEEFGP